jgi:hypothetical protein
MAARRTIFTALAIVCGLGFFSGCRPTNEPKPVEIPLVTREALAAIIAGDLGEELIVRNAQLTDDDLALLVEAPQLKRVQIHGPEFTFGNPRLAFGDVAIGHLAKLPNLEWINIPGGEVTDDGLSEVGALKNLRILNLHQTQITDSGLQTLAPLQHLELLRFGSPHVTDAGIEHIAAINSLRFLHLIDVPITDAALKSIAAMPQLESFYLDGGNATDEGLSALVKARSDLHFHQDQRHLDDDPRRDDHSHGHEHSHHN